MDVIRQFGGVALTLALLAGALWWLRRRRVIEWRGSRTSRVIEVIESRGIAPGHTLHLVRVADRVMALETHPAGSTLLEARPWSEFETAITPHEVKL